MNYDSLSLFCCLHSHGFYSLIVRSPLRRSKLSRSQILGPSMPGEDLFRAETMSQKFQTHVNDQKVSWLGAICCKAESWPIFASGGSCTEPPKKGIHASWKHPEGDVSLQLDRLTRFPVSWVSSVPGKWDTEKAQVFLKRLNSQMEIIS